MQPVYCIYSQQSSFHLYVLSESFMHLPLRPIFRQSHPNFINVRTAYASKIWAQLTKNLLAKSSTKRFREYIKKKEGNIYDSKCNYIAPYIWLLWSGDLLETYRCVKGQLQQLWKRKKWLWRWLRRLQRTLQQLWKCSCTSWGRS